MIDPSVLKILKYQNLQQHKDIKHGEKRDIYFVECFVKSSRVQQPQRSNLKHKQPKHVEFWLNGTWRQFCESSPAVLLILLVQSAGWESGDLQEQFGIAHYLTLNQTSPLSSTQTLTVKDLLLSNLGQTVRREEFNISMKE